MATDDSRPVVEAMDVRKGFDDRKTLKGIDLTVEENTTTVFMGPNGSGKTVFLCCLAGSMFPDSGTIDVLGSTPQDARSSMNFMVQDGMALPDISGRENVQFYTGLHPEATDEWRSIVDRVDLADDLDRHTRHYSGGMLRKLELAIALSVDVPLYLLDEPTAELDMTTVKTFHSIIEEKKAEGKTVVLTSHTPLDIEIADRIVFIADGRVVASGTPEALSGPVPPVVRTQGTDVRDELAEYVEFDEYFETESGRKIFGDPDYDAAELEAAVAEAGLSDVSVEEPTHADMFNYYTAFA